jgi:hypothetical protein
MRREGIEAVAAAATPRVVRANFRGGIVGIRERLAVDKIFRNTR